MFYYFLIPVMLMLIGAKTLLMPHAEKFLYHYSTKLSRINQDTSHFAQKYFGKAALICGAVSLIPSVILMILAQGDLGGLYRVLFMSLIVIQIAGVFIAVVFTENALKKNFDESGNKK
jgi:FtsH-binding integral membrane protein